MSVRTSVFIAPGGQSSTRGRTMFDQLANHATTTRTPTAAQVEGDAADFSDAEGEGYAQDGGGIGGDGDWDDEDLGVAANVGPAADQGGGGGWGDQYRVAEEQAAAAKKEKMELINRLHRHASSGQEVRVDISMSTHIDDLRLELGRIEHEATVKDSIRMQRKMLLLTVNLLEWGNKRYDPVGAKLDGWSQSVMSDSEGFDSIFAALHEKYGGANPMPPEMQLMLALGGSAVMVHLSNSMAEQAMGALKQPPGRGGLGAPARPPAAAPEAKAGVKGKGKMVPPPSTGILSGLFRSSKPAPGEGPSETAAAPADAAPVAANPEGDEGRGEQDSAPLLGAPAAGGDPEIAPVFVEVSRNPAADDDPSDPTWTPELEGGEKTLVIEDKGKKRGGGRKKSSNTGAQPLEV